MRGDQIVRTPRSPLHLHQNPPPASTPHAGPHAEAERPPQQLGVSPLVASSASFAPSCPLPPSTPSPSPHLLGGSAIRGASSAFTHASRSSACPELSPEMKGDSTSSREEPPWSILTMTGAGLNAPGEGGVSALTSTLWRASQLPPEAIGSLFTCSTLVERQRKVLP